MSTQKPNDNTMLFRNPILGRGQTPEDILLIVYNALKEKGYDPVMQIVGYLMSGDPTYITSHNNARSLIRRFERDELMEVVLRCWVDNKAERR